MGQKPINIGDGIPSPSSKHQVVQTIFLSQSSTSTGLYLFNFLDGSIEYFDKEIKQTFEYVLVDNVGPGKVRIAFNRPGLDLTVSRNGAKTLRRGDSLYIQDSIRNLTLYFLETSLVEMILISK